MSGRLDFFHLPRGKRIWVECRRIRKPELVGKESGRRHRPADGWIPGSLNHTGFTDHPRIQTFRPVLPRDSVPATDSASGFTKH